MAPSHTQEMLTQVVLRNQQAFALAAQGCVAEARTLLKNALRLLLDLTSEDIARLDNSSSTASRNILSQSLDFPQKEWFCVCNALLILDHQVAFDSSSLLDIDVSYCSAIVLFNLALIYHQRAAVGGITKQYQEADALYLKSLVVLQNFSILENVNIDALKLSVLNNRFHIRLCLGLATGEATNALAEEIRVICSALMASDLILPHHLQEDTINEIVINTLMAVPQCASCA